METELVERGMRPVSRSIFNQRRNRLRTRRILIVSVAVLLVAALLATAVLLIRGNGKGDASTTPSSQSPSADTGNAPALKPVRELPVDFIARHTRAPRIALYDVSAQTMLFSKNADKECAPASLTKLMTALVALEYATPETPITAGNELYLLDPESSRAGIYIGHKMTLEQALYGLLLKSGNDAAYVIAAQVGHLIDDKASGQDAIDLFCKKMTEKAADLGCTNTTFLNPDGIDKKGHQTTANDLLKIALTALDHPLLSQIMATEETTVTFLSGQVKTWKNSNKLIQSDSGYTYEGTIGVKTGTTGEAKNCLISCATRKDRDTDEERTILCVLLGAETDAGRYNESIELLNLGFF